MGGKPEVDHPRAQFNNPRDPRLSSPLVVGLVRGAQATVVRLLDPEGTRF